MLSQDPVPLSPDACLPDFLNNYQLGDLIGEQAFSNVKLATVKVDGPYRDMQVAVKCVERHNLRREDEKTLLEEVRAVARLQKGAWLPGKTSSVVGEWNYLILLQ